jgi:hypothetical protein
MKPPFAERLKTLGLNSSRITGAGKGSAFGSRKRSKDRSDPLTLAERPHQLVVRGVEATSAGAPRGPPRHGPDEQPLYTWGKPFGGFQANDGRRLKSWEVEKKWLPSVRPAPLSLSNHRCSGIYDAPII